MNLGDQLERISRFLRDPNGSIWGRSFLINLYNDAQKEIQIKTGYLEAVEVLNIPPTYQWSYLYDWEWPFMDGSKFHQALNYQERGDFVFCHIFEPQVDYFGLGSDANDWGPHHTQVWEAWMSLGTGDLVSVRFPENFHSVQLLAYDREPLDAVTRKNVTNRDTDYVVHTGEPRWYWRDDDLDNSFIAYPRPSMVDWNEVVEPGDPNYIYTFDWEFTHLGLDDHFAQNWTRTNGEFEHVFLWETDPALTDGMRGMFVFEAGVSHAGQAGSVLYVSGDTTDALGTFQVRTGSIFSQEEGIAVQVLDDTNNFLLIYDVMPKDMTFDSDESDFPRFMRKYVEHTVISRAYGANTDGKIQSLSDYWSYRAEVGTQMIKRFMAKKKADRDYRLITSQRDPRRTMRHPRLPSTYPAI